MLHLQRKASKMKLLSFGKQGRGCEVKCDPKCMLRSRCALKMNYCKSRISIYLQVYFCTLAFTYLMCK